MNRIILFLILIPVVISQCSAPIEPPQPIEPPLTANTEPARISINYPLYDGVFIWGMIGKILENTNILELNGIKGDIQCLSDSVKTTSYFLTGKTDISLNSTGGVSISLIKATTGGTPCKLVAILGAGGRNALIVPYDSPITDVKDLKGKKILNPIMGALLDRFIEPGKLTRKDVVLTEKYHYGADVIEEFKKGTFDAAMSWDPYVQEYTEKKQARILAHDPYHLEILVNDKLLKNSPDTVVDFLVAFKEAIFFMKENEDLALKWYCESSGMDIGLIRRCLKYADVYNEIQDIKKAEDFSLIPPENKITDMQNVANAMQWSGVLKSMGLPDIQVNIKGAIDFEVISKADNKLKQRGRYPPERIKLIKNESY